MELLKALIDLAMNPIIAAPLALTLLKLAVEIYKGR